MHRLYPLAAAVALALTACTPPQGGPEQAAAAGSGSLWPELQSPLPVVAEKEQQLSQLLQNMTIEQKVAQLIQPDIRWMTLEDMRTYGFGSYLNGGGAYPNDNKAASASDWLALAQQLHEAGVDASQDGSSIPPIWGTDAVHGHNNVRGATVFPHNIGLGAANNPALVEAIGKATAEEVAATGIHWVFAPTVAVARDDRWGRSYESYSEDPAIVKSLGAALVKGLQGPVGPEFLAPGRVIATAKHYLADGGTSGGKDQGNAEITEQQLIDLHAQGYFSSLDAGVQTVMASFSSWNGEKMHGNGYLLTEVLKKRLGFDGVVVGDWNGHGQVPGCTNQSCAAAINAGVDILMVPEHWKDLYHNTLAQAKAGDISAERLDDAVRRILRVKQRAGLLDNYQGPAGNPFAGKQEVIGAAEHQALAAQAVRESLVLLKNNGQLLPLNPKQRILVTGDGADSIAKQSGGWTVTWQGTGTSNADFPQGQSIYAGIAAQVQAAGGSVEHSSDGRFKDKPDVAVVVIGENPYAEFDGDTPSLDYQAGKNSDEALLKRLKAAGIPVVTVFLSGRPLWVNPELNASDAFVAAWLPGTSAGAMADLLLRDAEGKVQQDFKGKLSFSWPKTADSQPLNQGDAGYDPLFALGYGLSVLDKVLVPELPEQAAGQQSAQGSFALFERRAANGLNLHLADATASVLVNANKVQSADGSLKLAAVNWQKQEDALQLNWSEGSKAALVLQAARPFDASGYQQLQFHLNWAAAPTAPVMLGASCGSGCGGAVDLVPQLSSQTAGEWHSITVNLACLADAGAALNHLEQPFSLQSSGAWQAKIANIRLVPAAATDCTAK
ncbi:glycoside hydrolase family 3 N-terminal domain-containing protein [Rheinheimera sp.]|uniref:glycoside hydrolase family 3 protein n=1 Tax=Rheinheimera sp. TaxID=1869214 RepID=UPI00307E591B